MMEPLEIYAERSQFSIFQNEMRCELSKVSLFAAGNLMLVPVANFLDKASQILHVLLTLGQVGVATVTIIYIIKKTRALRKPRAK